MCVCSIQQTTSFKYTLDQHRHTLYVDRINIFVYIVSPKVLSTQETEKKTRLNLSCVCRYILHVSNVSVVLCHLSITTVSQLCKCKAIWFGCKWFLFNKYIFEM